MGTFTGTRMRTSMGVVNGDLHGNRDIHGDGDRDTHGDRGRGHPQGGTSTGTCEDVRTIGLETSTAIGLEPSMGHGDIHGVGDLWDMSGNFPEVGMRTGGRK